MNYNVEDVSVVSVTLPLKLYMTTIITWSSQGDGEDYKEPDQGHHHIQVLVERFLRCQARLPLRSFLGRKVDALAFTEQQQVIAATYSHRRSTPVLEMILIIKLMMQLSRLFTEKINYEKKKKEHNEKTSLSGY